MPSVTVSKLPWYIHLGTWLSFVLLPGIYIVGFMTLRAVHSLQVAHACH